MITLKKALEKKYKYSAVIVRCYEEANGVELTWDNLSRIRCSEFIKYMREKKNLSANSVRQYCARLKAVINLYKDEVEVAKGVQEMLSTRAVPVLNTWLTEDDLQKLAAYKATTGNERQVQARFLIGAYSGARFCDFSRLDKRNIVNGMLTYISKKTKKQATIPVKPLVIELLDKVVMQDMPDATFNDILRRIAEKAGINEPVKVFKAGQDVEGPKFNFISSHTARRSFATNLYLRGADLYSISRMLGHSSVEMTAENYICCGLKPQSEKVMEYFD